MTKHISAKVLADSITPDGKRLTTFEIKVPRIILAEFNTHRVLSRNFASSRAIPVIDGLEAQTCPSYVAFTLQGCRAWLMDV